MVGEPKYGAVKLLREYDIRKVQLQLGRKDIRTTLICTQITEYVSEDEWSPADEL
jgi:hypothetical protein